MVERMIAILGTGKMGEALLSGLLRAGRPPSDVAVVVRREARGDELRAAYGVPVVTAEEAAKSAATLVVAVKPQDMGAMLDQIAGLVDRVAAGDLARGRDHDRVHRAAVPGRGAGGPGDDQHAAAGERGDVGDLGRLVRVGGAPADRGGDAQSPVGKVLRLPEYQQDAATALAGSGPAYVYYLIEAMADAGVLVGMPRRTALELVTQAVYGAATMVRDSGEHPVILREAVTSPGGTTIAAIRELESHGVRGAIFAAIEAARNRGRELGGA